MGFRFHAHPGRLVVTLSGFDRLCVGRRTLAIPAECVTAAFGMARHDLEADIDHRAAGIGTHDGRRRPGRRRVGSMLGRGARGPQFWAVESGPPDRRLLVLDLSPPVETFVKAVLACDEHESFTTQFER